MSQGANVRSTEAIRDFKITLIDFAEEAHNALTAVEMEIRQVRNWLLRDQLSFWQSQVKKGQERVAMARTELHRRQLSQSNSDAISDTEQREALREAQKRLRLAEEKVIIIKKWAPILEHAISEYHSQAQPLGDRLTGSFVATLSLVDRLLGTLESYLATAAPSTAPLPRAPRPAREEVTSEATNSTEPETVEQAKPEPADDSAAALSPSDKEQNA